MKVNKKEFINDPIIAKKDSKVGIPYNTKIECPENIEIVVVSNGSVRRLKRIEEGVINPKKFTLFKNQRDPKQYTVYLIDKSTFDASWGGNILYEDNKVNNIQEKIFIRANFSFSIIKGDKFINLLSENQTKFSQRYVVGKLRSKIDNIIKQFTYESLSKFGPVEVQKDLLNISKNAMNALNETVLYNFGIELSNLNISIEEDDEHAFQRNQIEWNKLSTMEVK